MKTVILSTLLALSSTTLVFGVNNNSSLSADSIALSSATCCKAVGLPKATCCDAKNKMADCKDAQKKVTNEASKALKSKCSSCKQTGKKAINKASKAVKAGTKKVSTASKNAVKKTVESQVEKLK